MGGRFYSTSLTTTAGGDLIAQIEATLGLSIAASTVTLISTADVKVCINELKDANGDIIYSDLYLDTDALYKLSLKSEEVLVSSIKTEDASQTIWIGIIF